MLMKPPTLPDNYAHFVPYDELVRALRLIEHATAPTHEDGAYHECAHDLSTEILARVDARAKYDASITGQAEGSQS